MKSWACKIALVAALGSSAFAEDQPAPTGWQIPAAADDSVDPSEAGAVMAAPSQDAPSVATSPPNWAGAAMTAIDPKYAEGIVVVTARDGTPEPRQWIIVARDTDNLGTLHKITVVDGQVVSDVLSMNAYESFRQNVNIDQTQMQVDSGDAFLIAQPLITAAKHNIIGHVDYALTVRGKDSAPIWTLNCFDMNGGFLGKVVLLATTGTVIEQPR